MARSQSKIFWDRLSWRLIRTIRGFRGNSFPDISKQNPWMSPDVWNAVSAAYADKTKPSVFEYGSGASTLWHIRNLIDSGGSYAVVEHHEKWLSLIDSELREWTQQNGIELVRKETVRNSHVDIDMRLRRADVECAVRLSFRPTDIVRTTQDGSAEEFSSYVSTLDTPVDCVIVDGRARVACVNAVLDNHLVNPGGTLILHDAGSGTSNWLGHPSPVGTADYRPAVARMVESGGHVLNGTGIDSWNDGSRRRSGVNARYYPLEACIMTFPV